MKKNPTALMAALTMTAIVLGAVLLSNNARPTDAAMLNAQSGFSLMTAGVTGGNESLVIIDKASQKMVVYDLVNGNDFKLIGFYNLSK